MDFRQDSPSGPGCYEQLKAIPRKRRPFYRKGILDQYPREYCKRGARMLNRLMRSLSVVGSEESPDLNAVSSIWPEQRHFPLQHSQGAQ
jgi:hypothetical protein